MKTNHSMNLNLIQESDALGIVAQSRQDDIRRDKPAVSMQRSLHHSEIVRWVWRFGFVCVIGIATMIVIAMSWRLV